MSGRLIFLAVLGFMTVVPVAGAAAYESFPFPSSCDFDQEIDESAARSLQPTILNHRCNDFHRLYRRALRLHSLRPTDDFGCLGFCAQFLGDQQPLHVYGS